MSRGRTRRDQNGSRAPGDTGVEADATSQEAGSREPADGSEAEAVEDSATGQAVVEEPAEAGAERGDGGAERTQAERTQEDALGPDRERYLRLAADFENFRRRSQQELLDRSRYASADAARELVPVLDNLRRAVDHTPADGAESTLLDGLTLVVREFETALERLGVVAIDAVGSAFDPAVHEAIGGEESEQVDRDTVIDEVQRGYRLHDRVVRPALVRVAHPKG